MNTEQARYTHIDNVKALLIILVVIGHFIETCIDNSNLSKSIFWFIYLFHMPLFIFLNGLMCKHTIKNKQIYLQNFLFYLSLYFLLKFFIYITKIFFGKSPTLYLFRESGIPWYMLALAAYYTFAYLFKQHNKYFLLAFSIVLSLFSGYDKTIGDFLILSRIIVFLPFFILGWSFDLNTLKRMSCSLRLKLLGFVVFSTTLMIAFIFIDDIYFLRPLLTGRNSFKSLNENFYYGALYRALVFVASALVSVSFIILTPKRNYFWSILGRRTLQIYFWHRPLLYILDYGGVYSLLENYLGWRWGRAAWLVVAIGLTFALSWKPLGKPFELLRSYCRPTASSNYSSTIPD